ncbi:MAG TPA: PilZ domain-containing protein [Tepidisphaeraceae bacterium]|nr:PilZ domain-containing protein [Tepidisphaeraceae bacterium]
MTLHLNVERRQSPRVRCTEKQAVSWKPGWLGIRKQGWLYDLSDEGMSLLVASQDAPRIGAEMKITRESDGSHVSAQVVRIQPAGTGRVLVGCRIAEPVTHRPMMALAEAA